MVKGHHGASETYPVKLWPWANNAPWLDTSPLTNMCGLSTYVFLVINGIKYY